MRVRTTEQIEQPSSGVDWKMVDTALRTIAQRRGSLDALEAKWIREALRVKIWREVGCVTMAEYLERRLGYAPRTAYDRVRVAMALEDLPKLAAALEAGLPHSAVRALTRVCTNENEQKWLDGARGKSVHEIENMVAGRARGSDPEDPPDLNLVGKTLPFEGVRPATEALVRDARRALQEERANGEVMSDDDVLAAFARCVLERGTGERSIAPYQVAVGLCERCGCGWQESGGRKFALSKADTERACCDAQWIGRVDGGAPERATQDVPPSVRRMVHRRARGRCEIPGCRSTRCLEIHHIVPRSVGGSHDPENLILTCDGCHAAHHRGLIAIRGTASELIVGRKHELAYDMVANDESADDTTLFEESEPTAEVGTNVAPTSERVSLEPSAHVSTSSNHQPEQVVPSGRLAAPISEILEPSAHVSTPNGTRSAARSEPQTAYRESFESGARASTPFSSSRSRYEHERIRSQARLALTTLGYRSGEAGQAVDLAIRNGYDTLEAVIREALRSCVRSS